MLRFKLEKKTHSAVNCVRGRQYMNEQSELLPGLEETRWSKLSDNRWVSSMYICKPVVYNKFTLLNITNPFQHKHLQYFYIHVEDIFNL